MGTPYRKKEGRTLKRKFEGDAKYAHKHMEQGSTGQQKEELKTG